MTLARFIAAPRIAGALALVATLAMSTAARADEDRDALLSRGTAALEQDKPKDAIDAFEALADRGVVDARVSFDRGLAYAKRARMAEVPGDLGRAAHGFEEARDLTRDPALAAQATRALVSIRSEVARRRTRAGDPVEVEQHPSLGESIVRVAADDTWAFAAIAASVALALSLAIRSLSSSRRTRIGATIGASVAAPATALLALCAHGARTDRLERREAVVVVAAAHPADARHIAMSGQAPLPEGARVRVLGADGDYTRIRWGALEGFLPTSTLRPLARAE